MSLIHKTAIIEKNVWLDDKVEIGAFSILKEGCIVGYGTKIFNHVEIGGAVVIGKNNNIHKGVFIGQVPQFRDLPSNNFLYPIEIGDDNKIYEYVTIHLGVERKTKIGNRNIIMGQSHLAHDVILEDDICLANQTLVGGFCEIESHAFISAHISLHPYVRIGFGSMVGASLFIKKDIPPYGLIGNRFLSGVNKIKLLRLNFDYKIIDFIRSVLKILFSKNFQFNEKMNKVQDILKEIEIEKSNQSSIKKNIIEQFIVFINKTKRGFVSFKN